MDLLAAGLKGWFEGTVLGREHGEKPFCPKAFFLFAKFNTVLKSLYSTDFLSIFSFGIVQNIFSKKNLL